jgi:hypothetical protein
LIEVLQQREMDDAFRFDDLLRAWEKEMKDPDDILIEAKNLKKQRRKKAGKKAKRQRRGNEKQRA